MIGYFNFIMDFKEFDKVFNDVSGFYFVFLYFLMFMGVFIWERIKVDWD